jgi:cellulose synthase/poly-beta-1,6-N-acetylglucosamine synthase-like glycosyltransferase
MVLSPILNVCAAALVAAVLLPVCVLFVEVVPAVAGKRRPASSSQKRPRLAVLVPAHDEAAVIAVTLQSVIPQLQDADRVVVIADNCEDGTAAIAAGEGAQVIERTDAVRRGKGYALDFGVRHLEADPPDIVLVVDADCVAHPGAIDALARACATSGRPVQCLYLMNSGAAAGIRAQIATFAWLVKNHVRPLGLRRLGLPCQLMGTGMAFPWACLRDARLATGHIVEDLQLGIELAAAGYPPLFCPEATVVSDFPESQEGLQTQRTRWEHGHLGVILSQAPAMFGRSLATGNIGLFALALDLCVPPLALLAMAVAITWIMGALLLAAGLSRLPFALASAAVVLLGVAILAAWARFGRQIISLAGLAMVPLYMLAKLPIYARFLIGRQVQWVRSKRGPGASRP